MHKGTRALENVRFLKWCKACGVKAYWNIIYGFPGETQEDYERMCELLPSIRFLDPPQSCGQLNLDRYSPYFERPERYGFCNVRPHVAYRYVFPVPEASLGDIAYTFDFDYQPGVERPAAIGALRDGATSWQQRRIMGELREVKHQGERTLLVDLRPEAVGPRYVLDELDELLYEACGDICSRAELRALAQAAFPAEIAETVDERLALFVTNRLMIADGDRFLSLALPASSHSES